MAESKKYYAVVNGRKCGIFESWEECKEQIIGFKGAKFKKFSDKAQAFCYLENPQAETKKETSDEHANQDSNKAIAYVDGSYNVKTQEFSCGVVIFYQNKIYEFSKKFDDKELASMRNVAGEIKGSETAIKFCLSNDIPTLKIYHDYEGVAKWANGEWKANKSGTRAYSAFCKKSREKLNITFVKVKAHSGNKYNDKADLLAKKALGMCATLQQI